MLIKVYLFLKKKIGSKNLVEKILGYVNDNFRLGFLLRNPAIFTKEFNDLKDKSSELTYELIKTNKNSCIEEIKEIEEKFKFLLSAVKNHKYINLYEMVFKSNNNFAKIIFEFLTKYQEMSFLDFYDYGPKKDILLISINHKKESVLGFYVLLKEKKFCLNVNNTYEFCICGFCTNDTFKNYKSLKCLDYFMKTYAKNLKIKCGKYDYIKKESFKISLAEAYFCLQF